MPLSLQIEILQREFERAAAQYPGLMHVLAVWPEDEYSDIVTPDDIAAYYDEKRVCCAWHDTHGNRYTPGMVTMHWLTRPAQKSWNCIKANGHFNMLAGYGGQLLYESGFLQRLGLMERFGNYPFLDYPERWMLSVHELSEPIITVLKGGGVKSVKKFHAWFLGNSSRTVPRAVYAPCVQEIGDVWMASTLLCSKLLSLQTTAEQEPTDPGGGTAADIASQECSKPMSKSKMMDALKIDSYKTFNAWAKDKGMKQVGNRQTFTIRLDLLDAKTRQKVERA